MCSYPRREDCRLCGNEPPRLGPRFAPIDVVRGFVLYWEAAIRVVTDKAYMGKIALAVTLGIIVFAILAYLGVQVIHPLITGLLGFEWLPGWVSRGIALLLTLVTGFFFFPVIVTLFLFPVLDPLSRLAEAEILGFDPPAHPRGPIADFWDSLDTGARILSYQLLAWLICLPLALTGVGIPIAIAVSAFFAGFSWLDYPASRRGLRFGAKWALARRHWALLTGYGLGFLLGLLVPFFKACVAGPAGAVGAADLWFTSEKEPAD